MFGDTEMILDDNETIVTDTQPIFDGTDTCNDIQTMSGRYRSDIQTIFMDSETISRDREQIVDDMLTHFTDAEMICSDIQTIIGRYPNTI